MATGQFVGTSQTSGSIAEYVYWDWDINITMWVSCFQKVQKALHLNQKITTLNAARINGLIGTNTDIAKQKKN